VFILLMILLHAHGSNHTHVHMVSERAVSVLQCTTRVLPPVTLLLVVHDSLTLYSTQSFGLLAAMMMYR
jgi:hypothetical protein